MRPVLLETGKWGIFSCFSVDSKCFTIIYTRVLLFSHPNLFLKSIQIRTLYLSTSALPLRFWRLQIEHKLCVNPSGAHGTSQESHVTRCWRGYEKQPRDISQLLWPFDLSDVSFSSSAGLTRSQTQRSMSAAKMGRRGVKGSEESSGKLFIFHFLSCPSVWKMSFSINTCLSVCMTK